MSNHPSVFLALPHRNDLSMGTVKGLLSTGTGHKVVLHDRTGSILTTVFNWLWCDALNMRERHKLTHFAMLHCDIAPQEDWLTILLEEMERTGADILSAVSPLKDFRGLTSTGLWDPAGNGMIRRLTVKDVAKLPETFTAADTEHPDWTLLINTGCWICRFAESWAERITFRQQDEIFRQADGSFAHRGISEDWLLSLDAHDLGLKVAATSKVKLRHKGEHSFSNHGGWGSWETDREFSPQEQQLQGA